MSATLLAAPPVRNTPSSGPLQDVVDFAAPEHLPDVPWLHRLQLPRQRVNVACLSPTTRRFKRALDIVAAIGLLIVLWPVMLLTALAVRLTSRGPVIYRQTRVGLNLRAGQPDRRQLDSVPPQPLDDRRSPGNDRRQQRTYGRHFTLYKFRTMRIDAEAAGAQFATQGDPRVTPIGRFMRKTRLDELPQLWNVLKGEMSLVGPRPERPVFIEQLSEQIPDYLARLGLQPGLTGVAQVVNGYDNDIESFRRKVAFDLMYLQNCCVVNDVKILLRTVRVVLTGSGAL